MQVDLSEINDELIKCLAKHPKKMQDLTPRKFVELVAELFRAKGYEVELTLALVAPVLLCGSCKWQ